MATRDHVERRLRDIGRELLLQQLIRLDGLLVLMHFLEGHESTTWETSQNKIIKTFIKTYP